MKPLLLTILICLPVLADTNQPPAATAPPDAVSTNAPAPAVATPAPPKTAPGITIEELRRLFHLTRLLASGQLDEHGDYKSPPDRLTQLLDAARFEQKAQANFRELELLLNKAERSLPDK